MDKKEKFGFAELLEDCSSKGTKLKTDNYLSEGKYAIVDQGQQLIAGYTDIEEGVYTEVPAIIFGDHTRVVKYIDVPFYLGADGTKLLKAKDSNANYKYLYYALKAAHIPNTGYNRHFKWVKELQFNYPPDDEQMKIVDQLDRLQLVIDKRNKQLEELDMLIKARFVEMFGTPENNEKGFPELRVDDVIEFTGGAQPDKKYFEYEQTDNNIRLIQIRDYKSDNYITYIPKSMARRFCDAEDIMIGRYGPPIFQILKGIEGAYNVALMKATPKKGNKEFIRGFLKQECLFNYLDGLSQRTAGQSGIEMPKLKSYPFPYPPIELQDEFERFANKVDKLKFGG